MATETASPENELIHMWSKFIFAALAVIFLTLAAARIASDGGRVAIASRTWLLIGAVFGVVSLGLFLMT